jgi:hypothetical protein
MDEDRKHRREARPERVRLASHIDMAKAKPWCRKCSGRGIVGYRTADLGDGEGEQKIPIICRCVSRAGGVQPDELDRILAETAKEVESGTFHEKFVADFHAIPDDGKPRVVAAFFRDLVDDRKAGASHDAVEKTVELLKRRKDWSDLRGMAIRILMRDAADESADDATRRLARRAMESARREMN